MPKKRTRKPPAEQLGFAFTDYDPRQRAFAFRPPPLELEPAPLARCTCLDAGDVGDRYEGIGGPMLEVFYEAEAGS